MYSYNPLGNVVIYDSNNGTKTYTNADTNHPWKSLALINDGAGVITITVNNIVINLLASDEGINESFADFTSVVITCTSVAYRLFLRS